MNRSSSTAPGRDAVVRRASELLGVDPAAAEKQAMALLNASPSDPRAALILGSALRRQSRFDAALAILSPLARAFPRAAVTQYEFGLALMALNRLAEAERALTTATLVNPDLADAWRALGDLRFAAGDGPGAAAAFAQHERASVSDPALKPAAQALFENRPAEAESRLRAWLRAKPEDAPALKLMADAVARQGREREAETLLDLCLKIDPSFWGARYAYAEVLFRRQKGFEALSQLEALMQRWPNDPAYRNLKAACLALVGEFDPALALYEGLLAEFPRQAAIWLNYGHALRTTRRTEEAVAAYRRCLAEAPNFGEAYWSLANLKTVPFSPSEIEAMAACLEAPNLSNADRLHFCYALGKALEDRGEAAGAFAHYERGAQLRRRELPYSAAEESRRRQRSEARFSPSFFAERRAGGAPDPDPIFIVGLPRSGSTLVEQILASHSRVEGTQELPDIGFIAEMLAGRDDLYPEVLAELDPARRYALGRLYLDRTRRYRVLGRPYFIDKMPNNFHHLGLIQLILPQARMIDVRRHPLGSGFSAFKQHFAQGQSFSYDLADIGLYYRDYVLLMRAFETALPGRVCRVIYEDLVENTEVQVRRLLAYCGLDFEPACLAFHKNQRAVRTVSSEQVRRPIYRDALDRWRDFEPFLEPLRAALGPVLQDWRS
jgi:tetratricopeptide (TPR) repeat protein